MIIRIVKMHFFEEHIPTFIAKFDAVKQKIRNTSGNQFLELYQDKNNRCIFFTYSIWETEEALEKYRKSELFSDTWTFTKRLFNEKPEAWSVDKLVSLS